MGCGASVLDVGCGTGGLTVEIARRCLPGGRVVGVDPDSSRLALARSQQAFQNIEWVNSEIGKYGFMPNTFDYCFSNYVLHWIDNGKQVEALHKAHALLNPGGRFGFTVIACVPQIVQGIGQILENQNLATGGESRGRYQKFATTPKAKSGFKGSVRPEIS